MIDRKRDAFVVLDLETCSLVDLRKSTPWAYAEDPSTQVLCWSASGLLWDDQTDGLACTGSVSWVHGGDELGGDLSNRGQLTKLLGSLRLCARAELTWDDVAFVAHNIQFERAIWTNILRPRMGWPECPPLERWIDTMALCGYHGLPLGLGDAGEALDLAVQKDGKGHRLMLQMARPRKVIRKADGTREVHWWHETSPDKLAYLSDYCTTDVDAEAELFSVLPDMSAREREIWLADQRANELGVHLDQPLVQALREVVQAEVPRLNEQVRVATNSVVPGFSAVGSLSHWLGMKIGLSDLRAGTVEQALRRDDLAPEVRAVLEARQAGAKTSAAKLDKMVSAVTPSTGRVNGLLQYCGAQRTGRWAGRVIQPQNMPRSPKGWGDEQALLFLGGGLGAPGACELFLDQRPMDAVSYSLRSCLRAAGDDRWLICADSSQIEARVICWLAGQNDVLEVFARGEDVYIYAVERIGGGASQRQLGKVMTLGLGFQMGAGRFQETANSAPYELGLSAEQAEGYVRAWRSANSDIVQFWYDLDAVALSMLRTRAQTRIPAGTAGRISFSYRPAKNGLPDALLMHLPSGRVLTYWQPQIETDPDFDRKGVTCMGVNQTTKRWERQRMYPGRWAENATQAVARDVVAEAFTAVGMRADVPMRALLSVHDEVIAETEPGADPARCLDWLVRAMSAQPRWAKGLPLAAEGFYARRYRK